MERSYYEILGVAPDASPEEIKRAYRKLALRDHPDKNPGDAQAEARFKELAAAYDVLREPERRREYDQILARGGRPSFEEFRGGASDPGRWSMEDILERFGDLFGAGFGPSYHRGRSAGRPGYDIESELEIDFRTAAMGGKTTVSIRGEAACADCGGKGAKGPSGTCSTCGGSGRLSRQSGEAGAFYTVTQLCPDCQGTGVGAGPPCGTCGATGAVDKRRTVAITIPEGIEPETVLKLRGLGGAGRRGGPPGDLLIRIHVRPDPHLRREGRDIHSDVEVPVSVAALGGKVPLRTLRGEVQLTVPPLSSSGKRLRLRRQGILDGDHVARVMIMLPSHLSEEQKRLFEKLAESKS